MGSRTTNRTWVLALSMTAAAFLKEARKHGLSVSSVWAESGLTEQLLLCAGHPAILSQGSDTSAGSKRLEWHQNTTGQCFRCQIPRHRSLSPNIRCFALAVLKKILQSVAPAPGVSPPGRLIYPPVLVLESLSPGFKVSLTPVQGAGGPAASREMSPWGGRALEQSKAGVSLSLQF